MGSLPRVCASDATASFSLTAYTRFESQNWQSIQRVTACHCECHSLVIFANAYYHNQCQWWHGKHLVKLVRKCVILVFLSFPHKSVSVCIKTRLEMCPRSEWVMVTWPKIGQSGVDRKRQNMFLTHLAYFCNFIYISLFSSQESGNCCIVACIHLEKAS